MTIRAKLYTAIVLTILGPLATTAVALHGMAQLGDSFDEVRASSESEGIARELKFLVTDMNGWQTAYGYDGEGGFRGLFVKSANDLRKELDLAAETFTSEGEVSLLEELDAEYESFMDLDVVAWRSLQSGDAERTKQILLGPELARFEAMAETADELAAYQQARADDADTAFDDARDEARKRLIAVALGAGLVIVLLLVTASDIARLALEREATVRGDRRREGQDDAGS